MASSNSNSLLGIYKIATVTGINAKTVATTTLYTVLTGNTLIVTSVIIRVTAFTAGGKSTQAGYDFGGNSTSFDDFTGGNVTVDTLGDMIMVYPATSSPLVTYAAATNFSINITTGSNATTETWTIDLFGYLI